MTGPVALITGASSGIGEVFSRRLAERGYRVVLVARRTARLDKLAAELGNAEVFTADLSNDADLSRVEQRIATEPELEFLVNNAGFGVHGVFHASSLEAQDRMHRLHVIAIERLTHAALNVMTRRGGGSIVNVSSGAGFLTTPFNVCYCATKAWINSFTEGLFLELRALGSPIRIQSLCPGFTYTEFHDTLGMDRNQIPRWLWMPAEKVVDLSLRKLKDDSLFVIPGWRYRLFFFLHALLPRRIKHLIALRYGKLP